MNVIFGRVNPKTYSYSKCGCFSRQFDNVSDLVKFLSSTPNIFIYESDMTEEDLILFKKKERAIYLTGNGICYNNRHWNRLIKKVRREINQYNSRSENMRKEFFRPYDDFMMTYFKSIETKYGRKFDAEYK